MVDYNQAVELHKQGTLLEAEQAYRQVIKQDPKHADALHQLGVLLLDLYGQDRFEEACGLIQKSINIVPKQAKYRHSLGVALRNAGKKQEAVDAFEAANEKDPLNVQILWNLGRTLREVGRMARAAEIYKAVCLLEPEHPQAHYKRAQCLRQVGRYEDALAEFRIHLKLIPEDREAGFWVAAITGDASQAAATATPPDVVAGLFDSYADNFDDHLVNALGYRTPNMLMDALLAACKDAPTDSPSPSPASSASAPRLAAAAAGSASCRPRSPPWSRCVDLGCGTGLMGPLLRPHVGQGGLEGVDLSKGMVDKAQVRGCYDKLAVAELVAYLNTDSSSSSNSEQALGSSGGKDGGAASCCEAVGGDGGSGGQGRAPPYDCVVAADVFVYLGDLQPVLAAAAARCLPGAVLAFSVEAYERNKAASTCTATADATADPARAFRVNPTGRYSHSQAYLGWVLERCGWQVVGVREEVIRQNAGQPVHGHLCVAVRR